MAEKNQSIARRAAEEIISQIQKQINEVQKNNYKGSGLSTICKNFINFYYKYYYREATAKEILNSQEKHQKNLKNAIEQKNIEEFNNKFVILDKTYTKRKEAFTTYAEAARTLETILNNFKILFLKFLGYEYIQQIVIDTDKGPIIIKLKTPDAMEAYIASATSQMSGKLKSNSLLLASYLKQKKENPEKVEQIVKNNIEKYKKVYTEARYRFNISQKKLKIKPGGIILFKPPQLSRWRHFYVINLGDFKEGYMHMVMHQKELSKSMEKNIEIFTKSIQTVDAVPGTLKQDIQIDNLQISSKSKFAETGSHQSLIKIIDDISKGKSLEDVLNKMYNTDNNQKHKERNKLLKNNKQIQKKIEDLFIKKDKEITEDIRNIIESSSKNIESLKREIAKRVQS